MQGISNEELDRMFDEGEDIIQFADLSAARRPNQERLTHVDLDIPEGVLRGIDREAARIGIDRQSVIKVWLAERLDQETASRPRMAGAGA
jgi:hypothetical protein